MAYKWTSPHDWLNDKLHNASAEDLFAYARDMSSKLDPDQLQDLFQTDMQADGYFDDQEEGQ